jgi:hypothetical protein
MTFGVLSKTYFRQYVCSPFKVYTLGLALLFFGAFVFIQLVKLSAAKKY